MKKIDFEKMEKIGGGKIWKEPQITSTSKKNQQSPVNSHISAVQNQSPIKTNC